jgi:hypothetical protein
MRYWINGPAVSVICSAVCRSPARPPWPNTSHTEARSALNAGGYLLEVATETSNRAYACSVSSSACAAFSVCAIHCMML